MTIKIRGLKNYPGYGVTQDGRVWSCKWQYGGRYKNSQSSKWRELKPSTDATTGYSKVTLSYSGKPITRDVHRLVAIAFLGDPHKMQVNHIDGVKSHNQVSNLEYVTASQNIKHAYANKLITPLRGYLHQNSKLTEDCVVAIRQGYLGGLFQSDLASIFGVNQSRISDVVNNLCYL